MSIRGAVEQVQIIVDRGDVWATVLERGRVTRRATALPQHTTKHGANLIRDIVCQTSAKKPTTMSGGCSSGSGLRVEDPGMA